MRGHLLAQLGLCGWQGGHEANTVLADATPAPAGIAHADAAPAGDVRRVNQVRDKASARPHDPGTG